MTSARGLLIGLCAGLVALALATYVARRDVSDGLDPDRGPGTDGAADWRGDGERAEDGARTGAAAPASRQHGGPAADGAAPASGRGSGPIADVRRRLQSRDVGAGTVDPGDAHGDRPEQPRAAPRAASDVLDGARIAVPEAGAGVERAPLPEGVLYDGADEIFDAQSLVQGPRVEPITTTAGSMSFWVKPEWQSGDAAHAHLVQLGEYGPRIVKDGDHVRLEYTNVVGGNELGGVFDTAGWDRGEWHHVTGTWENGTLTLYVDGEAVYANTPTSPPPAEDAPRLYIGTRPPADGRFIPPAQVSQVTVLNRSLSVEEVEQMFGAARPPQ